MILIDAIYINNSGGKIILDYLIESLEDQDVNVTYLLDERIRNNHPKIDKKNKTIYLKPSLKLRHSFYKSNRNSFHKILCFSNLPPSIKLKATVYTYFHQKLFLEIPKQLPLKQKLVFFIKSSIFKFLKSNTNFWIVQTEVMQKALAKSGISDTKILILPFYPNLPNLPKSEKLDKSFLYVSSGADHKNHNILLDAFKLHYDKYKTGQLHITVGDEFINLQVKIKQLVLDYYPIFNYGFVNREKLAKLYNSCTFVLYPSLSESFGLGILEGLENDCKIIGANLPYTFAVCNPSLIFDPTDVKSIIKTIQIACTAKVKPSQQLVFNEINKIIELLK
jgi:glycosyltransferase involved in cell wall biosynthesis